MGIPPVATSLWKPPRNDDSTASAVMAM